MKQLSKALMLFCIGCVTIGLSACEKEKGEIESGDLTGKWKVEEGYFIPYLNNTSVGRFDVRDDPKFGGQQIYYEFGSDNSVNIIYEGASYTETVRGSYEHINSQTIKLTDDEGVTLELKYSFSQGRLKLLWAEYPDPDDDAGYDKMEIEIILKKVS